MAKGDEAREPASAAKLSSKNDFVAEAEAMQDEADIEQIKAELQKELMQMPSEPEFNKDESGKPQKTFTKEFMLKLNHITSKYQLTMQEAVKNQQRNRRYDAIETNDDAAFTKAFFDLERRLTTAMLSVHDIIFDHFCIIPLQIEISGDLYDGDMQFKIAMFRQGQQL
jgi:hypothetical protein